mgnify:CR=1 FL=1
MKNLTFAIALLISVLLLACNAENGSSARFHALDISEVGWGRGLELSDTSGARRSLADFRGKVVVLFFGFTECTDHCPTALAEAAMLIRHLGKEGERVQVVFVTLDPERDTAERLSAYLSGFHPSFIALRGTPEETFKAATEFKVFYAASDREGGREQEYSIEHSDAMFVLDPQARLRLYVSPRERSVQRMSDDIRLLLGSASN